ncbi:MAG: response regulator, partial [Desulfovibrio sp.]|nr:response regulator [Desulfovibrio sp.]
CLLPPIFVAAGVFGLDFGIPANLLSSAPLWGAALSALLIAATGAPADMAAEAAVPKGRPADVKDTDESGIINLDHPLDDPNLRRVSGGKAPAAPETHGAGEAAGEAAPQGAGSAERARAEAREGALRGPLDDLLREGAALEQCALPPAVRQYASAMLAAARRMADVLSRPDAGEDGAGAETTDGGAATAFDLQRLLREAHGAVAPAAEYAGIGLAWYMPPHLGQLYRGDARTLGETLGLLLESAVRATRQGAVHLSARRVPESSDPGNILFTVTDTGAGAPPRERSSLALARAWELAARHGGYVGMEYGPNGTTIAFSLHLEPLEDSAEDMPGETLPHIIIVADDPAQRRELARMAADLPCRCSEAAGEHEALRRHEADPAVLLVAQGRYALPAAADMVTKFMEIAAEAGLSGCKVLAITEDDSQWNLLADSGFTHALLEPVDAEALRQTVRDVVRNARRTRPAVARVSEKAPEETQEAPAAGTGGDPGEEPATAGPVPAPGETGEDAVPSAASAASAVEMPGEREKSPPAGEEPDSPGAQSENAGTSSADEAAPESAPADGDGQSPHGTGGEGQAAGEDGAGAFSSVATTAGEEEAAPGPGEKSDEAGAEGAEEKSAPEVPPAPEHKPEQEAEAPATPEDDGAAEAAPEAAEPAQPGAMGETVVGSFMAYAVSAAPVAADTAGPEPGPAEEAGRQAAPCEEPPLAAPEREAAAPGVEASRPVAAAAPSPAPRASVYVSPALSSPGEWVGEPMPIGTPVARREPGEAGAPGAPESGRAPWQSAETRPAPAPREESPAWQRGSMPSAPGDYTSPSVPVPGEWVGEPVPIPRKREAPSEAGGAPSHAVPGNAEVASPGTPQTRPEASATEAPASEVSAPETSVPETSVPETSGPETSGRDARGAEAGSLMDFIVGATRAEPAPPAAQDRPREAQAEAGSPPSGGVTDFVERSVTLVTSAVSSALTASGEDDAASGADRSPSGDPAYAAASQGRPTHEAPSSSGASGDAAILALVARLDTAMAEASQAHAAGRGLMVAQAAARIAEESESFGFRVLARMARCVERAGRAGDMNALRDLLPELAVSVERNRTALTQHKYRDGPPWRPCGARLAQNIVTCQHSCARPGSCRSLPRLRGGNPKEASCTARFFCRSAAKPAASAPGRPWPRPWP